MLLPTKYIFNYIGKYPISITNKTFPKIEPTYCNFLSLVSIQSVLQAFEIIKMSLFRTVQNVWRRLEFAYGRRLEIVTFIIKSYSLI